MGLHRTQSLFDIFSEQRQFYAEND
jgi:hypothetical protein